MPVARGRSAVGKEPEILGATQRRLRHEPQGLAGIPAFAEGDLLGAFDDGIGYPVQHFLAFGRRKVTPGRKRVPCRMRRAINLIRTAAGDVADMRCVHWRPGRETCRGSDRFATDPMPDPALPEPLKVTGQLFDILLQVGQSCLLIDGTDEGFLPDFI